MERKRVPKAGVDIDICVQHGAWFDREQLRKVANAYLRQAPVVVQLSPTSTCHCPPPMSAQSQTVQGPDWTSEGTAALLAVVGAVAVAIFGPPWLADQQNK